MEKSLKKNIYMYIYTYMCESICCILKLAQHFKFTVHQYKKLKWFYMKIKSFLKIRKNGKP